MVWTHASTDLTNSLPRPRSRASYQSVVLSPNSSSSGGGAKDDLRNHPATRLFPVVSCRVPLSSGFGVVILKAPVQFVPLRLRQRHRSRHGRNAVPNVFDKLNALRNTQFQEVRKSNLAHIAENIIRPALGQPLAVLLFQALTHGTFATDGNIGEAAAPFFTPPWKKDACGETACPLF